ncbi:Rieske (2Fe-2S) protein [Streptomyces sp. NPDC088387]|uniref:Rieske (2Fe-2S) protein n=1 Tax=Streptomyces sp. NPDC088387 TaxID=3365859 RepID=UPI003821F228
MTHGTTRRTMLLATGAVGATALVTACGGDDDGGGDAQPTQSAQETQETQESPPGDAESSPATGPELATTADVPVGGGTILADEKIVLTQPDQGEILAFSAVCTHQGCTVADVSGGTINCACHGSKFSITDGSVAHGPATRPLPKEQITVTGDSITRA